jgi:hypothetical protein
MKRIIPLLAALALVACATDPSVNQSAQAPKDEKEYRTGSRIPVRDASTASPTTTLDASVLTPGMPRRN